MDKRLFFVSMVGFALFPLLPNKIKGLPVILLFIFSIYTFFKNKNYKFNFKKVILFSSLYILYLLSLIYTDNFSKIDKTLSTRLSLIVLPISFGFLSTKVKAVSKKSIIIFQKTFITSTVIFSLLILFYSYQIGFFSGKINILTLYSYLTNEMYVINQHPIYASLFISFGLFFCINLLVTVKEKSVKIILSISLFFLITMLFFLSRKGVIIGFFVASLMLLIYIYGKKNFRKIVFFFSTVILLLLLLFPTVKNRFSELFNFENYKTVKDESSSSIRYGIYKCAIKKIQKNILFGTGIGDVQDELNNCYKKTSQVLYKGSYNTHNQYLGVIMSNGLIGLIIFLFFLYSSYKIALDEQNLIFLTLLIFYSVTMLFENILDRQSGLILFCFFVNFNVFLKIEEN